MAFQKEAPIYLQVRRSELANIGLNITDPYDFQYIISNVATFINSVNDQYFFPYIEEVTYDTPITNPYCPQKTVNVFYDLDTLVVGGSSPFTPIIYSATNGIPNAKGILAGLQQFIGITREFDCYPKGNAPINPSMFQMVFRPYSEEDPVNIGNYLVNIVMAPTHMPPVSVPFAPGFVTIAFVKDNPTDPSATATGTYLFTVVPEADIILKP